DPLSIDIIPPASDFTGMTWLPADAINLVRSGLPNGPIKRGDAINMQIDLSALGLTGAQLPEVQIKGLGDQLKLYPDQPAFTDRTTDGETIEGHRVQTFVLIASKSGTLEIPEIQLRWWDRNNDRQEVASLPAIEIEVLPLKSNAGDTPANTGTTLVQKTQPSSSSAGQSADATQAGGVSSMWKWLSLASISGWLLSIIGFIYYRRRHWGKQSGPFGSFEETIDLRPLLKQIKASASNNQAEQTWQALQAYSRTRWMELPPRSPGDWSERLDSPDCGRAVAELDRHLFHAHTGDAWRGEHICKILLPKLDASLKKRAKPGEQGIPGLYPS
ncbi:MAG: hypothetical protein DRQ55_20600, partial [Planctomycetota bacterium]